MAKREMLAVLAAACLAVTVMAASPAAAQICRPDENGRVADAFYGDTAIFWDPVVEFHEMVLTIGGPCEDIIRVFRKGEEISFDIREIERVTDGAYTWELRRVASIDPGVQKKLQEARGTGEEDDLWWSFFQKGAIPDGPYVETGSFSVERGVILRPDEKEGKRASVASRGSNGASAGIAHASVGGGLSPALASDEGEGNVLATRATVLTNADGVIRNSLCVGFDCPNSPSFSDTTILMMENNTRIKFDDTSSINSFPRNDWEIEANSNLNGGASYIGFNDCGQSSQGGCATDLVFAVEAGVRQNALYVESDGDVGVGTANPVVRMHLIDGDTPALRLEQDGSSGFAPQIWDVAGNETTFFIRDATGGSQLPFRIQPGADSNSIFIESTNDVGIGTSSPTSSLHVRRSNATAQLLVEEVSGTAATRTLISMQNNGGVRLAFNDMNITSAAGDISLNPNVDVNVNGGLVVSGDLDVTGAKNFAVPDPADPTRAIYFAALEGPEAGTYYRGTATTVSGEAVIELPTYFAKLTETEGLTVQLTPIGGWGQLYVAESSPEKLVVRMAGEAPEDLRFHFFVQGVRKGYAGYQVERSAENLPQP